MGASTALPELWAAATNERRSSRRVPVALPAMIHVQGQRHAVQLLNLSPTGTMLSTNASIPVGTPVMLVCGAVAQVAVIKWQDGHLLGLRFEIGLAAGDIAVQVDRSNALETRVKERGSRLEISNLRVVKR